MRTIEETIRALQTSLRQGGYVAERTLATAVTLSLALSRPLLVEGPAGVGKTEIAKALAAHLETDLIRLQCYEGLDAAQALYEWDYPRQLLRIRLEEAGGGSLDERERHIFSEAYLLKRPLLDAIMRTKPPVLLIDEIDRADEAFEAFLLEVLSDFQVTIPEIGTIRATTPPVVILTSNRTRELGDALRRRCLYHWIPYPDEAKEREILSVRLPALAERLRTEIPRVMAALRSLSLEKTPGVAESLDWARSLVILEREALDAQAVADTLSSVLKDRDDLGRVSVEDILAMARKEPEEGTGP